MLNHRVCSLFIVGFYAGFGHPTVAEVWDAHTHLTLYGEGALSELKQSGVTAVRDCGSSPWDIRRWRDEIAAGKLDGPKIFFSGPILDGPKDAAVRLVVQTPEDGRKAVDTLAKLGVDFIKTHNALATDSFFAIVEQARMHHLKVAAHLPKGVPVWVAASAGVGSVEHAAESLLASPIYAGYAKDVDGAMAWWRSSDGDRAIQQLALSGVAITPTLVAYETLVDMRRETPEYERFLVVFQFLIELVGRLHQGGVTLLAGSDFSSPTLPVRPGRSLFRELELLKQAGLSDADTRDAAGKNVSKWFEGSHASSSRLFGVHLNAH
jgi:hypothetical protein